MKLTTPRDGETMTGERMVATIQAILNVAMDHGSVTLELGTTESLALMRAVRVMKSKEMRRLMKLLQTVTGSQPTLPPGVVLDTPKSQREDIALWQEAQTAPLDDLMMAYTTITSRLVDLVDEGKVD